MYLLDTNTCIHFLNGNSIKVKQQLQNHAPSEITLCSVVKAELLYGARYSQKVEVNLQRLKQFFAPLASLPFDDRCAEEYAQIRADLTRQGKLIGPNDLMIAAITRAHDAILVTNNTAEFQRVANLRLVDWL
ncbi:type II toxin-antitoxin system VapC family toxin [uncultured Thiothrix sp.]|uniref:type II toxin-antitoxin system tRNA(fMet)-specific endonuclease VapC n=1 Tax=uncultured Thiothrix sp. TaxID=223185 RepID=UPI0026387744|nr:type II toxin-antitoxin system VapC family toxin [uncultured Thiothrix sp.]